MLFKWLQLNISVIFRNTPHGRQTSNNYPPLEKPEEPWNNYHYPEFSRQNEIARDLIQNKFPSVIYLDFFTSTVLRVDSHKDPL